ncbi:hypothetical protein Pla163_18000 [Planctomycetes bacterium Pla163]|uniref:Uncharacterized protein n=1 Tax=Rohdeia mirabilis TaxID=2528008 RepID=A0A518CZP0_9BACT|nr:hypothetical protein Pla163_18000 [Planctomycetes bacterium Pla163]
MGRHDEVDRSGAPDTARAEAIERYTDQLLERTAGDERDRDAVERALRAWRRERDGSGESESAPVLPLARRFGRSALVRLASAAGVLLAVAVAALFLIGPGAPTADAALAGALERARAATPRMYELLFERGLGFTRAVEADLYVSGEQTFALALEKPAGTAWIGGDRAQVWVVPANPQLPVVLGDRARRTQQLLAENDVELPYVDVVSALEALSVDYDAALSADGLVLSGTKRATAPEHKADTFRLVLDEDGALASLELERRGRIALGDWRFELQARDTEVDGSVFDHASHHRADRRVIER